MFPHKKLMKKTRRNVWFRRGAHVATFVCFVGAVTQVKRAVAQAPMNEKRWPDMPLKVKVNLKDPNEDVPGPNLPPEAKAPGSDPWIPLVGSSSKVKGVFVYSADAWDGDQTPPYWVIVWRSLNSPRLMPLRHLGDQKTNLLSDVATYLNNSGEVGADNFHLSPDGHVLALEGGYGFERYGKYFLYEWDLVAGRVRVLTPPSIASLEPVFIRKWLFVFGSGRAGQKKVPEQDA